MTDKTVKELSKRFERLEQKFERSPFPPGTELDWYLTMLSTCGGNTSPSSPGSYECSQNSEVEITAIPSDSFTFLSWTVNGIPNYSTTNPLSLVMIQSYNVQALFGFEGTSKLNGFETGDFSDWDYSNLTLAGSTLSHHGCYCAEETNPTSMKKATKVVTNSNIYYGRIWFKFTSLPSFSAVGNWVPILSFTHTPYDQANQTAYVGIGRPSGTGLKWVLGHNLTGSLQYFSTASPSIQVDTWYCVKLYVYFDGNSSGEVRVYVNDTQILSDSESLTVHSDQFPINRIGIGATFSNASVSNWISIYDCVWYETFNFDCDTGGHF